MGDGGHMQGHVGRAAHAQTHPHGQLQHLLGHDVPGADILLHQTYDGFAAEFGYPVFLAADGVGAGAARKGEAQGLRHHRHGVGRAHHGAGAGGGGHEPLHVLIFLAGELSTGELTGHLLELVGGVGAALVDGGHHGAAGDNDRGQVDPQGRHQHGGHDLVTAADEHQTVQLVAGGVHVDGVGDDLPAGQHAAHTHVALGEAVADGDGVDLEGDAPRLQNAVPHQLAQPVQMDVAGVHLVIGVDDADEGLGQVLIVQPHAPQMGPGACHTQTVYHLGTGILGIFINEIQCLFHGSCLLVSG